MVRENSGGHLALLSLRKANATRDEVFGVAVYEMELAGTVRADTRLLLQFAGAPSPHGGGLHYGPERRIGVSIVPQQDVLLPGREYPVEGSVLFTLKENGWDMGRIELIVPPQAEEPPQPLPERAAGPIEPASARWWEQVDQRLADEASAREPGWYLYPVRQHHYPSRPVSMYCENPRDWVPYLGLQGRPAYVEPALQACRARGLRYDGRSRCNETQRAPEIHCVAP